LQLETHNSNLQLHNLQILGPIIMGFDYLTNILHFAFDHSTFIDNLRLTG